MQGPRIDDREVPPATRGTVRMWKRGLRHGKAKRQAQMRERRKKKNRVKSKETAKSASEAGKKNREKKQTNKQRTMQNEKKLCKYNFERLSLSASKKKFHGVISFLLSRTNNTKRNESCAYLQ